MTKNEHLAVKVLTSNRLQFWLHVTLACVFLLTIYPAMTTELGNSVKLVNFLSLWALVATHWGGALAAKAALTAGQVLEENETD